MVGFTGEEAAVADAAASCCSCFSGAMVAERSIPRAPSDSTDVEEVARLERQLLLLQSLCRRCGSRELEKGIRETTVPELVRGASQHCSALCLSAEPSTAVVTEFVG